MERTQFTFYESFATALRHIRKKSDRCAAYDAIVEYALYGREPDMETLPNAAAIALELIRPNLDASRRRAAAGHAGGIATANVRQSASKKESEKENENEREIEKESYTTAPVVPPPQKRLNRAQRRELEERERQRRADEQLLRNVAELPRILAEMAVDPP